MAADAGTDTAATACTGDVDFFKFPRTHHIADAGGSGVTRDDLVMSSGDAEQFLAKGSATVSVEEKVDGANLGFSVDPTTQQLMMQNRGHFVNEETAAQWRCVRILHTSLQHAKSPLCASTHRQRRPHAQWTQRVASGAPL